MLLEYPPILQTFALKASRPDVLLNLREAPGAFKLETILKKPLNVSAFVLFHLLSQHLYLAGFKFCFQRCKWKITSSGLMGLFQIRVTLADCRIYYFNFITHPQWNCIALGIKLTTHQKKRAAHKYQAENGLQHFKSHVNSRKSSSYGSHRLQKNARTHSAWIHRRTVQ